MEFPLILPPLVRLGTDGLMVDDVVLTDHVPALGFSPTPHSWAV